ncbi:MAG: Rieske [2Fe-2S] iron-sulfur domain-containing protein [Monoraphidium minutum]|nr:MAG: Rieske [2Fe-2S] iron-sulfur domain-containing protein [Monoraphidium minutum]
MHARTHTQHPPQTHVTPAWQLDPAKPTAATLLGIPLVIWRDGTGAWSVLEDRCPHRLAPLSEGRIEPSDGTLFCSYHGWRFDAGGKCRDIPQIEDDKARATACGSSRACVRAFPCQVRTRAAAAPPPLRCRCHRRRAGRLPPRRPSRCGPLSCRPAPRAATHSDHDAAD